MDEHRNAAWSWPRAGALVALVFASYATVLMTGGWIWDDPEYVTRNPVLDPTASGGLWKIWFDPAATPQYYPMVHTTFWIESRLFPLETIQGPGGTTIEPHPTGFHLTNVLLFAGTVLLFLRLLGRLLLPGAFFAAALLAVHPVNVESVAWVTERKNMLSGLFMVLTALVYLRFAGIGNPPVQPARRPVWWLLALACFGLGLLSKTVIAFVPPALWLIVWWRRPAEWRFHALALLPFLALAVVAGLFTAWLEVTKVSGGQSFFDLTVLDRCMLAGTVVWTYFLHLLVPWQQAFFYAKWQPDAASLWQWGLFVAALAVPLGLWWQRGRLGKGPLVAFLVFGGALFPVMGFLDVYPFRFSWVADHFQYHANFALFAGLGALAARGTVGTGRRVAGGIVLAALTVLTARQGLVYQNEETLWRDTLAKTPASFIAHQNLGRLLLERGEYDAAGLHLREAVTLTETARGHLGLAQLALLQFFAGKQVDKGKLEAARAAGERALVLWPDMPEAHLVLSRVHGTAGRTARARQHMESFVHHACELAREHSALAPRLRQADMHNAMGRLYRAYLLAGQAALAAGDARAALAHFARATQPIDGTDTPPARDLYPWVAGSPWFELEVARIWVLACTGDESVRDPKRAAAGLEQLIGSWQQRLRASGITAGDRVFRRSLLETEDLQAGVLAAMGEFGHARRILGRVLERVAAPQGANAWVGGLRERKSLYDQGRTFRLKGPVPLAPR